MNLEMLKAKEELGTESFENHLRTVFGIECLDFVKTIVINLPEPCYANCEYCIDNYLRHNSIDNITFLKICEKVLKEFPTVRSVSITGGSLNSIHFNCLVDLIRKYLPESRISWNTNGVGLDFSYSNAISKINRANLHRNSVNEEENKKIFKSNKQILSIDEAKTLFGEKLNLRITIDESFDLDEYSKLGIPLYLNRLLPGTDKTDKVFNDTLKKLNISDNIDNRRRNVYLTANYNEIPVRICMGDKLATHVPNRKPTFLNVAIIHRSGIVCGSWYEDDKVIFNPHDQLNKNINDNIQEQNENVKVLSKKIK